MTQQILKELRDAPIAKDTEGPAMCLVELMASQGLEIQAKTFDQIKARLLKEEKKVAAKIEKFI